MTLGSKAMLRGLLLLLLLIGAATGARAAEVTYDLRIANGRVPADMRLIRVKQNDVVKLRWRADKRTEIHLHGYDVSRTIEPGGVTELAFTARATGRFTIEPHVARPSGGHAHGSVLVTIEVYP
jgi:FtsP/CotA-like multicopper oxidase with cupredoxin domain